MPKKSFLILSAGLVLLEICGPGNLNAQQGAVGKDSLKAWLCKTWQADYALAEGMKITRRPGAVDIIYIFNPDNTFVINPGDRKNSQYGTWEYNPEKKFILLRKRGRRDSRIISLIREELVMLIEIKNTMPDNPQDLKMVFKVKRD